MNMGCIGSIKKYAKLEKLEEEEDRYLNRDIVIEILSRIPTYQILEFGRTFSRSRYLISTSYFAQKRLGRCNHSTIFLFHVTKSDEMTELYYLAEAEGTSKMMIRRFDTMIQFFHLPSWTKYNLRPRLWGSCDGLLIFGSKRQNFSGRSKFFYIVYNPITRKEFVIEKPYPYKAKGILHGAYKHRRTGKYIFLYEILEKDKSSTYFTSTYEQQIWKQLCTISYYRYNNCLPIAVNGFLYWIAYSSDKKRGSCDKGSPCSLAIIAFNMDSEEIKAMPHPDGRNCPQNDDAKYFIRLRLLQMDNHLSFLKVYEKFMTKADVEIWELKDPANWIWVKRYRILNYLESKPRFPFCSFDRPALFTLYPGEALLFNKVKLLNIQNGELLFWYKRGLFRYHFQRKTTTKVDVKGFDIGRESLSTDTTSLGICALF